MLFNRLVKDMVILGIAQEIYAHAVCYYASNVIKALGIKSSMVDEIRNRANPIDIADGGDTWQRQIAFAAIWGLNPAF